MTGHRYQQVKDFVSQGIAELRYREGDSVPSENMLAESLGVSRMTARRALKELIDEGALIARQGQGTFVAPAKSRTAVLKVRNIAEEIEARGHWHSAEVLALQEVLDACLAKRFGISEESPLFFSSILHRENAEPLQLERRWVNPKIVPEYLEQNFIELTTHEYLMSVSPLSQAEHQISAILASAEIREQLAMASDEACLKVQRTTWSGTDIVSVAELFHPGNRYQLDSHLALS